MQWCASQHLQFECHQHGSHYVIWFGSKASLAQLESTDCTLPVGSEMMQQVPTVRDLCVLLDSSLTVVLCSGVHLNTCSLNAINMEVIMSFGLAQRPILPSSNPLPVGSKMIHPVPTIRDLCVLLDSSLTMKQHVNKVAAACYCQLRRLRQIRRRVSPEVTTQLVLALVTSRLDYCNSVLASLPQSTVEPLQRVQNAAARMIFNLGRHEHVTPCFIQLHWLPVRFRITYKLCTLMYNIRAGKCP